MPVLASLSRLALAVFLLGPVAVAVAQDAPAAGFPPGAASAPTSIVVEPVGLPHTAQRVGAGQGVFVRDDFLYLYGDAETGIIREYDLAAARAGRLEPTGRDILLTRDGEDLASHPTGLTWHPEYGTLLGDTVNRQGAIYHLDWDRALADGDLDDAVLHVIRDDAAVNGTRPEFVRVDGRWLVATSDYGDMDNAVRLYDPVRLLEVDRTSEEGVLVAEYPCGPFVQTLHWIDDLGTLVLVQNQVAGLRYRFTFARLDGPGRDLRSCPVLDLPGLEDELEGFALLGGGRAVMFSAWPEDNVRFAEVRLTGCP